MAAEVTQASASSVDARNAMRARDYEAGQRDRRFGIYDKWYRYNHRDEGKAYDEGWRSSSENDRWNNLTILD